MRILLAHNYYQIPGGEDELFECTRELLRSHGHEVVEYVRRNHEIRDYSALQKLTLPARTVWAWDSKAEFARVLAETKPEVAHFGNLFPLISPAAYDACHEAGVAVVQSLDNPRLMCIGGSFFRDGDLCTDCRSGMPLAGVVHGCYRGSRVQSMVAQAFVSVHRARGTWRDTVDAYLVATEFYRKQFVEGGLPGDRIHVRPLPIQCAQGARDSGAGDYALYMGRLSPEKGVLLLLEAWRELGVPLKIRGEGDLMDRVRDFTSAHANVEIVGRLDREARNTLVRNARFLVWPSQGYYETFGNVVTEAFGCGVPVVAAKTGIAEERVEHGITGLLFDAVDPASLASAASWAWEHPDETRAMGRRAYQHYETSLNDDVCYRGILSAYRAALARVGAKAAAVVAAH